jgi:type II restriction enzyme
MQNIDYRDNLISIDLPAIRSVLSILLQDKTTHHNIIWATNSYSDHGIGYDERDEITIMSLNGLDNMELQPRVYKSLEAQKKRTKLKAEVFTPSWICNLMNNHVNEQWFKRPDVFNVMDENHNWKSKNGKIGFKELKHTWQDYVYLRVIEITCGEAPYLVSRYDTVTGKPIKISKRIGMLDRKLRVVNENTTTEDEWFTWVKKAYQSTYGYEWQGDNLLIARINMLLTFIDYMKHKWDREPTLNELKEISKIIVWNIFQMDGLTYEIPLGGPISSVQMSIDDENVVVNKSNYVIIKNWRNGKDSLRIPFNELTNKERRGHMKFDVCIGNPPYQDETIGNNEKFAPPIYHKFIDCGAQIANETLMIHPGRFLFNAGSTPKEWNQKILNNNHFKVVFYEPQSKNIFPTADIKGGVAITYQNNKETFEPIVVFVSYKELASILQKVKDVTTDFLIDIVYLQNKYLLDKMYIEYPEIRKCIGSDGADKRFRSNAFDKIKLFSDTQNSKDDIGVIGVVKNKRTWRYFPKRFIDLEHDNINKYKVLVPAANGSGALGEVHSTPLIGEPLIGEPLIGYTQTFIGIGAFSAKNEAENALKYIKTKFSRVMLGILKITQSNNKDVWAYVPMQDFTENSDIDWSKSITEIDQQLYRKYGLTQKEIDFIEENVKSMDDKVVEEEDSNEEND